MPLLVAHEREHPERWRCARDVEMLIIHFGCYFEGGDQRMLALEAGDGANFDRNHSALMREYFRELEPMLSSVPTGTHVLGGLSEYCKHLPQR